MGLVEVLVGLVAACVALALVARGVGIPPAVALVFGGMAFAFIPGEGGAPPGDPKPAQPAVHVHAVEERAELEITFPVLDGYRMEVPDELFFEAFDEWEGRLWETLAKVRGVFVSRVDEAHGLCLCRSTVLN